VKPIFLLMTAMLMCSSTALAGELKVAVPVDEFKKMQSRLESLEQENNQLKQGVKRSDAAASSAGVEIQNRLQIVEKENNRLRQELSSLKASQASQGNDALAKESNNGKDVANSEGAPAASNSEAGGVQNRLAKAEQDNSDLRQEVKLLQAGALAEVYGENKMSAREQYFLNRRDNIKHVYKF